MDLMQLLRQLQQQYAPGAGMQGNGEWMGPPKGVVPQHPGVPLQFLPIPDRYQHYFDTGNQFQNTDWSKFEREARPSMNLEDNRLGRMQPLSILGFENRD